MKPPVVISPPARWLEAQLRFCREHGELLKDRWMERRCSRCGRP